MFCVDNIFVDIYRNLVALSCVFLLLLGVANSIIQRLVHGVAQNETYNRIADVVDKFGHRLTGSKSLEDAIGNKAIVTSIN